MKNNHRSLPFITHHNPLTHAIINSPEIPLNQKKLLSAIASHDNVLRDGVSISVWMLAETIGYTPGYVSQLISRAKKSGYLKSTRQFLQIHGTLYPSCNIYHLTLPNSVLSLEGQTYDHL